MFYIAPVEASSQHFNGDFMKRLSALRTCIPRRRILVGAGLATLAGIGSGLRTVAVAADATGAAPGKPAPAFSVPDTTGRARTLAEFKGRTVVLEWTSPSCPFAAAQYKSGRMQALQRWATGKGVVWLTVLSSHPSRSDYLAPDQAASFNRNRGGVPTALLIDASGTMGHAYGAATADHMFIVGGNGTLLYAGGIDDSDSTNPEEVARSHNYVRAALEEIAAGRRVTTTLTEPAGCAVAYAGSAP